MVKKEGNLLFSRRFLLTIGFSLSTGNSDQTNAVVQYGAVPIFIRLLESNILSLIEQVVWALGECVLALLSLSVYNFCL